MVQSGFIAAIDLGTSKITGVVGRKNENNVISVLACETIPSNRCIRRGLVYNIEETAAKVRKLVSMLENKLGRRIGKVYVSLAGQSLHTMEYSEMKQLASSGIVTESVVAQLRESAERFQPELKKKYAIGDVEYFVDDKPEKNPVGVTCTQIEANYSVILGRPNLLSNMEKSVKDKAGMQVAGYIVGPLASAQIALNEEERELGCAFVDFGAGTTTLSIYKTGILRRMVVIPFGGSAITRDICELNFIEADAEQYKIKFGKAQENQESSLFSSPFSAKADIDLVELNKVIVMRLDEITANLKEQIKLSGYEGQLGAGVIITGRASQLKNLDLYLSKKLDLTVRRASAKKSFVNNSPDLTNDPSLTQALGMLLLGNLDCEEVIVEETDNESEEKTGGVSSKRFGELRDKVKKEKKKKEEKKRASGGGFMSKMGDVFSGMFADEEEDDE